MHVFLDSNILYGDPFFKNVFNKMLLDLAVRKGLKLVISEVVYEEVINNYIKKVTEHLENINKEKNKLKKLITNIDEEIIIQKEATQYVHTLRTFYDKLKEEEVINVISYQNGILPELVKRSINRIKPFSENKQEFRDGIIWLSYINYANEYNLDRCFLITSNKEDFLDENGNLHSELLSDSDKFTAYLSTKHFVEDNRKEINKIQVEIELYEWLKDEDLENNKDVILELIENQEFDTVHYSCANFIENQGMESIQTKYDMYDPGYVECHSSQIHEIGTMSVNVIANQILITGHLSITSYIEVYVYNPYRDRDDDKFTHVGGDEVELDAVFSLSMTKDYDIESFEIEDVNYD